MHFFFAFHSSAVSRNQTAPFTPSTLRLGSSLAKYPSSSLLTRTLHKKPNTIQPSSLPLYNKMCLFPVSTPVLPFRPGLPGILSPICPLINSLQASGFCPWCSSKDTLTLLCTCRVSTHFWSRNLHSFVRVAMTRYPRLCDWNSRNLLFIVWGLLVHN